MTVKFAREVFKSVSLNETTIDIYVQPFDMDSYAQSQQVTRRRELKKGGGKASISGVEVPITSSEKEDLLGSLNLESFNFIALLLKQLLLFLNLVQSQVNL